MHREGFVMVMRKHQRYFPVVAAPGGPDAPLLPAFITVANGSVDQKVVAAGGLVFEKASLLPTFITVANNLVDQAFITVANDLVDQAFITVANNLVDQAFITLANDLVDQAFITVANGSRLKHFNHKIKYL